MVEDSGSVRRHCRRRGLGLHADDALGRVSVAQHFFRLCSLPDEMEMTMSGPTREVK
jgi:hypothetical protein